MDDDIQFGDLVFDKSFLFARRGLSEELKFTRAERAMLLLLTANSRKIVTRNRLLDAITGAGSDSTDRNVDFVINRLRAKLGDSARNPSFIATQHGEGYVWIADPAKGVTSVLSKQHQRSARVRFCCVLGARSMLKPPMTRSSFWNRMGKLHRARLYSRLR